MQEKEHNNLANLNINIGEKLVETINILEVLDEIIDGDAKIMALLKIVKNNIISSFNDIELCRKMICDFE